MVCVSDGKVYTVSSDNNEADHLYFLVQIENVMKNTEKA